MNLAVMPLTDYKDMCDKVREKIPVNLLENATFEEREINEVYHDIFLCSSPFHLEDDKEYTINFPNATASNNFIYIAGVDWNTSNYIPASILDTKFPYSFIPIDLCNPTPESREYRIFIYKPNSANYIDTTDVSLTKADNTITSGEMPSKIEDVYEEGTEAGQKAIFERIQDGGKTQNYYYAFAYNRFDDTNFFPVYPIKCSNGDTPGKYMFYNATGLTDTKVEIVANSNNINYAFGGCSSLVTIRKVTVYESTTFTNTFGGCNNLVEIRFGGTIGKSISFAVCSKLSTASVDSIIEHLKDLTGATSQTLTVNKNVYNRMVADGRDALVTAKNWTLVSA